MKLVFVILMVASIIMTGTLITKIMNADPSDPVQNEGLVKLAQHVIAIDILVMITGCAAFLN